MCQLWLNLPAKFKMVAPNYQPISNQGIPSVDVQGASVRIIAGKVLGVTGPAKTFSPVELLDVTFTPFSVNQSIEIDLPKGHTIIVFVRRGGVSIGSDNHETLGPQSVAILDSKDDESSEETLATLRLTAKENDSAIMILG